MYAAVAPRRAFIWWFFLAASANLFIAECALAVSGCLIVRRRGAAWASSGAALMWVGAAIYAAGVASWAGLYFGVTEPLALDRTTSTRLLDAANADVAHLFGPVLLGGVIGIVGRAVLSVGFWRARALPRWLILTFAVSQPATLALSESAGVGLVAEMVVALTAVSVAWYAWRSTRRQTLAPLSA